MELHEQRFVLALRAMNSELAANNRAVATRLGLNESDLAVLDLLNREGPQTPTVLARRTHMSPTTMTSVLRRLVRDGWVERRTSEADLRSVTIHPTSVEHLAQVFTPANQELHDLVSSLPDGQADQIIGFLTRVTDIIHKTSQSLASRSSDDTTAP